MKSTISGKGAAAPFTVPESAKSADSYANLPPSRQTLIRISRKGLPTVLLRVPESVSWLDVVTYCQKIFAPR